MKLFKTHLFVALLFSALAALFLPSVSAQVAPTTYGTFDTGSTNVAGSSTLVVSSSPIYVRSERGLAILPLMCTTNASTANVICNFAVSHDGTNYSTTSISVTNVLNGTTAVRGYQNIPASALNNVRTIRLQSIVNAHTATVWVTNVTWSISN